MNPKEKENHPKTGLKPESDPAVSRLSISFVE